MQLWPIHPPTDDTQTQQHFIITFMDCCCCCCWLYYHCRVVVFFQYFFLYYAILCRHSCHMPQQHANTHIFTYLCFCICICVSVCGRHASQALIIACLFVYERLISYLYSHVVLDCKFSSNILVIMRGK